MIQKKCNKWTLIYGSWRISSNFYHEKNQITSKFSSAGYPMRFANSVINDFDIKSMTQLYPIIYLVILNQSLVFN